MNRRTPTRRAIWSRVAVGVIDGQRKDETTPISAPTPISAQTTPISAPRAGTAAVLMDEAPTTPGRYPRGRPRKGEVRPPKPPPRPRERLRKKEGPPPRPAGPRGAPKGPHRPADAGPLAAARIAKGLTLQ